MDILVFVLCIVVIIFVVTSVKIVKQSEVYIVERLGKFHKKAESGLNIVIPLLDRVAKKIDLRTLVVDSPPHAVITKDNVTMSIDTVVYYQITDPYKATYEIQNLDIAITFLTTTTLRDIIGTMELDQTLSSRDDINNRLRLALDGATDHWGVRIERVEVKTIELPGDIKEAMEKQMRAEREKRAAILVAEGQRDAAISQAEGQKRASILEAEGQSEAVAKLAIAESNRMRLLYKALKESEIDESMLSIKYIEALNEMAKGNNKVFMPFETSGIMGAIGSIQNINDVKQSFLKKDAIDVNKNIDINKEILGKTLNSEDQKKVEIDRNEIDNRQVDI